MPKSILDQLRDVVLSLPEVEEKQSAGAPAFYIRSKAFCRFHDRDYGKDDRVSTWCRAPKGVAEELTASEPARFFEPTPSASGVFAGWLGVYLDTSGRDAPDWAELAAILEEAYRQVAPKRLVAELDECAQP